MTFDELQKTWRSQQADPKLVIDPELLLKQIKRNKEYFESAIFWRDVREIGAGFVASIFLFAGCVFFWLLGLKNFVWPLLLLLVLGTGVGTFILVDRITQKRKCPEHSGTLMGYIESSLTQIVHQIWLLKNILWWYLLPLGGGLLIWYSYCGLMVIMLKGMKASLGYLFFVLACIIGTILFCWGVYWLNQRAIRKELAPRKHELEELLSSLKNSKV
jgi:hypothetical protein